MHLVAHYGYDDDNDDDDDDYVDDDDDDDDDDDEDDDEDEDDSVHGSFLCSSLATTGTCGSYTITTRATSSILSSRICLRR